MNVGQNSRISPKELSTLYGCKFQIVLQLLNGKWKALIIWNLKDGPVRFGGLKKSMPGITEKMLSHELRDFENSGIVERKIFSQIPPKVEYKLTELGQTLIPILDLMNSWENNKNNPCSESSNFFQ